MPELPEVETIKTALEKEIIQDELNDVELFFPGMIQDEDPDRFCKELTGMTVSDIRRTGKYLLIYLHKDDNEKVMIIHLRMTGQLLLSSQSLGSVKEKHPHLRVRFHFSSGRLLDFIDQRKFATIGLVDKGEEHHFKGIKYLGPEPLSREFVFDEFYKKMSSSKKSAKGILLDQKIVAGLGNIYADEVLFEAGIHPERLGLEMSDDEIYRLYNSIQEVIKKAIEFRGTTFSDYKDSYGKAGTFQDHLKVYLRQGDKCFKCGSVIEKIRVCDRGTCVCPTCQPVEE